MKLGAMWELYRLTSVWKNLTPSSRRIYEQGMSFLEEFMETDANLVGCWVAYALV